ncbi:MAG: molybdopterin-dependent oxidoreductase [Chloroflexota bacterium]|nr:molybdopterin-dependent oxidoreductase [Chloroflexota bacterium]
MPDEITISIDGQEITTQTGKMVLEAAIDSGIYIPYLCYHSGLKPFAACRMCVVAVEGGRGFPASCTLPVQDGMKVRTESPEVQELRRSVMEMLIAEHPNGCLTCHRVDICGPSDICLRHVSVNDRCVTCPKNERCEFKDTVRYLGMELESPLGYQYKQIPLEVSDPFYDRDYNLCITCGRCVRVCEEIRGDDAIGFTQRSGRALVGTSFGDSLLESGCEFCGACLDVCPVGALVERDNKWEKANKIVPAICPHCPVGCSLNLEISANDSLIRVIPELNSSVNHGQACFKGKFGLGFVNNDSRLTKPLIRKENILEEATWEEALDLIASKLMQYRGNTSALIAAPDSTNEELYLAQKFGRVAMGTNNIDQSTNVLPELTIGLERALGYAAATNPIWDLEKSECILVFNSNLTEQHNVVGIPVKRAVKNGTRLIVIDSREVELTRYSSSWLRPVPGTELLLLGGILKSIVDQGLEDFDWIQEFCEEPDTLRYALESLDLNEISEATQVSVISINEAANWFGASERSAIVYSLDNVVQTIQRDCVESLVDMALLTGNIGKSGTGLYPLRPGMNEQGAWDVGCTPARLPGRRLLTDDQGRQDIEEYWGCTLPQERGMGVIELFEAAESGDLKSMFIIGDMPHLDPISLSALGKLDFLIVEDVFLTGLAEKANVVLPRQTFAEKIGTFTNLERRIQKHDPNMRSNDTGGRSEAWILAQLSNRMGMTGFDHPSSSDVMEEVSAIVPDYSGVSYKRLEEVRKIVDGSLPIPLFTGTAVGNLANMEIPKPTQLLYASGHTEGIPWPCTDESESSDILYSKGFPVGKATTITPEFRVPESTLCPEYPLWYIPGRVLFQRDREITIEKDGQLNRIVREELVQLNSHDALVLGVASGDRVLVETGNGRLEGVVHLDDQIPSGAIAVTFLFGQLAVELQTSSTPNPMGLMPGLDIQSAKLIQV